MKVIESVLLCTRWFKCCHCTTLVMSLNLLREIHFLKPCAVIWGGKLRTYWAPGRGVDTMETGANVIGLREFWCLCRHSQKSKVKFTNVLTLLCYAHVSNLLYKYKYKYIKVNKYINIYFRNPWALELYDLEIKEQCNYFPHKSNINGITWLRQQKAVDFFNPEIKKQLTFLLDRINME